VIRKIKWVDKMIAEGTMWLLVIAFVAAVIIGILRAFNQIDTAQTLEIVALTTLVLITAWYAKHTATMAKEMREQRYDAFRPIIDIVEMPIEPTEKVKKAFDAGDGKFPEELPCVLRNIGVGPAIGVSSFIIVPSNGGQRSWDFGTIAVGEKTSEFRLSPQQIGDRMFLVAYYKDVHGRDVESRREVTLDKERHGWKIHPMETQVRKITKEGVQR
jgi:flagellar biosynthesis protein FliQ